LIEAISLDPGSLLPYEALVAGLMRARRFYAAALICRTAIAVYPLNPGFRAALEEALSAIDSINRCGASGLH
jgi:hypothetical protein